MSPFELRHTVHVIHAGGLIAYPTEAVYGLGCDPFNAQAVLRLLHLKQRSWTKGLIVVAQNIAQLEPLIETRFITPDIMASWPGAATWLIPARKTCPEWLHGEHSSLAVRISAHPLVAALCAAWQGPLVSTSANLAARRPARNALQVRRYFGDSLDHIVAGSLGGRARPTPIRDARTGELIRC